MNKISKILGLFVFIITTLIYINGLKANDSAAVIRLCFPDNTSPLNNVILANLSSSLPVESGKPCLNYSVSFASEITTSAVKMYYRNAKINHPVVFQRFSLRDLLLPTTVTVDIEFLNDNQNVEKKEVQFSMEQSGLFYTFNIPAGKKVTTAKVTIKKTELGQLMLDKIVSRQQAIADYYTSDVQIKLMEEELKKIDFDNIENIEQFQDITRKVLNVVNRIREKKLDEVLFLNENDPLKLMNRLQSLYALAHGHKTKLTKQTANINQEYYRLGIEQLSKENIDSAISLFNKAIEMKPRFSMPYIKIASIEESKYNTAKAIALIQFVDKETDHDSLSRNESSILISKILNDMTADARLLRQQGNFTDALEQIDSCYTLCNQISFMQCDKSVDLERNEIYTALFSQGIIQNQKVLEQKMYSLYLEKTDSLYTYKQAYNEYINNQTIFFEHLNAAYQFLVAQGEANINGNPSGALDALMASKQMCNKYSQVVCHPKVEGLISSVFGKIYESMVDEAILLFNAQKIDQSDSLQHKARGYCQQQQLTLVEKHTLLIKNIKQYRYTSIMELLEKGIYMGCNALEMADSALQMKKQYSLNAVNNESEIVSFAARSCIKGSLVEAEKFLISKQFSDVIVSLDKAENLMKAYKIELDQPTIARIAEIRGLLEQGICGEIKFKIDIQLNAADIHQRELEYHFAILALRKAKEIVNDNPNCGFTVDDIINRIDYLKIGAEYQNDKDIIVQNIQNHKHETATALLFKLEQQYSDSTLNVYNLNHQTTSQFIKKYDYTPFTLGAIEYLADQGKTEIALELMYFLYDKETLSSLTEKAQIKLGRSLAKRDVAKQKGQEATMVVYQYIRHDETYFKKLIKSYKSQWKKSIAS